MAHKKHAYESSHPWLKFHLDLSYLPSRVWMMLGEAQSKIEHIAGVPLRPDVADELHRVYLAKGAHATTAIEGNTLSEEDVRRQIDGELKLPPSKEYLAREIKNITNAFGAIFTECMEEAKPLSPDVICKYHEMVFEGLSADGDEDVVPGRLRTHNVMVADYRGAPPQDCNLLLEKLCDWLNSSEFQGTKENRVAFAILRAIVAHVYIAWIHPFGDGNGRTARLIEFQILSNAGVPTPAAHLLSNFYNDTRTEYYRQLAYASKSGGDINVFVEYAVRGLIDGLREQLARIREQQWLIAWRDHVFRAFDGKKNATDERRRRLALALPNDRPVEFLQAGTLTPEIAQDYRGKSDMTIRRDLSYLVDLELAIKVPGGYRSNRDRIRQFLPHRANNDV